MQEIISLKPYPTGNDLLSALHAFDIADKHKLIITVANAGKLSSAEFARILPNVASYEGVSIILSEGVSICQKFTGTRAERRGHRHKIRAGEYERDVQPTFEICFGPNQPLAMKSVVPTLLLIAENVKLVVEKLASAF